MWLREAKTWLTVFALWLAAPFLVPAAVILAAVEGFRDLYGRG